MPAITTPRTAHRISRPAATASSQATAHTAVSIFSALSGLHGLPETDAELVARAAAGLRFIQSIDRYSDSDHRLFRVALTQLTENDALAVEASACYAAECAEHIDERLWRCRAHMTGQRVLWFAAILRLADALCAHGSTGPVHVYATWTEEALYLEFDGPWMMEARIALARGRVAALEATSRRHTVLASSAARRGAA